MFSEFNYIFLSLFKKMRELFIKQCYSALEKLYELGRVEDFNVIQQPEDKASDSLIAADICLQDILSVRYFGEIFLCQRILFDK